MSSSNPNSSVSKIEKSLGIGSKLSDLDNDVDNSVDEKKLLEDRRVLVKNTQDELNRLKAPGTTDEDFVRESLKKIAISGMTITKVMEEEIQLDPKARSAETAAAMISATTAALDKLQSITEHKDKMVIEKEKLEIKKITNNVGTVNAQIFVASGTMSDIIKSLKDNGGSDIGAVGVNAKPFITIESKVVEDPTANKEVETEE